MDPASACELGLTLPHMEERVPFGPDALVFKVAGIPGVKRGELGL